MKKGEKRKKELLMIAYRLFLSRGYENTSVDDIIEEAGIAKGTYYYYFESKEQMLEEVIAMMIDKEAEAAMMIAESDMPIPQKIVGVITSFRPAEEEFTIENAVNRPENVLMHEKTHIRLFEKVVPILSGIVVEGVNEGIFSCDNITERIKMLIHMSSYTFDDGDFTEKDVDVFIDMTEKLLGAAPGTMGFIRMVIGGI
ncbi:MAG: TetR/AcrR family transcriptional regulator [Lachnospiraceae bacterium]|nr:TetR/AcrR family transcriptional regulator [Lachnospiraceae bacterium]